MKIIPFEREHLIEAQMFADSFVGSRTFVHFRHTRPSAQLDTSKWRVGIMLDGPNIVGWGQAQIFPPPKLHIARLGLAVAEDRRGEGLGAELLDWLISKTSPRAKLTASVYADNPVSLELFRSRGFVQEGRFVGEEQWGDELRDIVSLALWRT